MPDDVGAEFFLSLHQVVEIFSFYPPVHEVEPVFICEYSILFGDEGVREFPPYIFQIDNSGLHILLDGLGFIDYSHGEFDVAI